MDCSTCSLAHSLASGETMCSSVEQWAVRTEESCWNSVNLCLLTFQRWEEDLGIPHSSCLTGGNPPCGWARATSRTSIWSELTKGVAYARSVRRLAEHSWSEENLRAVVETQQKWKSTTVDIPPAAPEVPDDEKEEPTAEPEEDEEMQEEQSDTKMSPGASSSGRGEKRTGTKGNVFVKKRLMMKSPQRSATPVTP